MSQSREEIRACRRKYYKKNREKILAYHKKWRINLRKRLLKKYGSKCVCCGESQWEFLSFDHVNNDGGEDRKAWARARNYKSLSTSASYYLELLNSPKRKDLRILCGSCHFAYTHFGYCPHQTTV